MGIDQSPQLAVRRQGQAKNGLHPLQAAEKPPLADVVEQILLAPDVMVEAALPDVEGTADLPHMGGTVPPLIEEGSGDPVQLLFPASRTLPGHLPSPASRGRFVMINLTNVS